jgi:putative acetyltransferase
VSAGAGPSATAAAVRPRADGDWPALVDLWVASWKATFADVDFDARREWLVQRLRALEAAGAVTLCLFDGASGAMAGFVTIHPKTGWLDQICIGPDRFGTGAASALLAAARKASPRRIGLDVTADNARAIRFYERQGFREIGEGPRSLSGRATVVMEWRAGTKDGR